MEFLKTGTRVKIKIGFFKRIKGIFWNIKSFGIGPKSGFIAANNSNSDSYKVDCGPNQLWDVACECVEVVDDVRT